MSLKAFNVQLPDAYRSVDFKVFEGFSKISMGVCKEDINNLTFLNSADKCPNNLLPLLCGKIGMPYFNNAIPYVNRQILKCWRWMMKNKGSQPAMRLMCSFALMSFAKSESDVKNIIYYSSSIDVYLRTYKTIVREGQLDLIYPNIRNYIEIFYEQIPDLDIEVIEKRLLEYLNYVRPASWRVKFQPALIQREGGEGKGLVIDSRIQNITISPEEYNIGHSQIKDSPDENRHDSGVDFSEVWNLNNPQDPNGSGG